MGCRCAVLDCDGGPWTFSFPNPHRDPTRFMIWVGSTGDKDIVGQLIRTIKNRKIYVKHSGEFFQLNVNLTSSAVPTLNLPDPINMTPYRIEMDALIKIKTSNNCGSNENRTRTEGGSH